MTTETAVRADERARCIASILEVEAALREVHKVALSGPDNGPVIKTLGFFDGITIARHVLEIGR
jgi:hypothetical protein